MLEGCNCAPYFGPKMDGREYAVIARVQGRRWAAVEESIAKV